MAGAIVNPYAVAAGQLSYEETLLALGPVGMWMLDESSGNAIDQGTAGIDGTYTGSVTRAARTVFGLTAPDFDEGTSRVSIADNAAWSAHAGASGVMSWVGLVRFDSGNSGNGSWLSKFSAIKQEFKFWQYAANGNHRGEMFSKYGNTSTYATYATGALDTDQFIVYTYDRTIPKIICYVDGSEANTRGATIYLTEDAGEALQIGGEPGTKAYGGAICGVALFDKVLTPSEITALYDAAVAGV